MLLALAVASLALAGCASAGGGSASAEGGSGETESRAKDAKDGDDAEQVVPVEVAALARGSIESLLRFSTNLEAESQVQVYSQAKRLVRELRVEEGDRVRRGQTLLRLQDEEQRSAVAKAKSQLEKAEREYERLKRLWEQELVSREAFTNAVFEVEQLQLALADAERELSYTDVNAPIAGTVTARLVNLGDQVQIGQHLFDIVDFGSIVARIFVPEKQLPGLRPGLEARVTASASVSGEFTGHVDRIAPVVDPASGTVKVTIALGEDPALRPGLYVDVDLVMETHGDALLVPKQALVYDRDQMFVYRVGDDRRVERVRVDAVLSDKDWVEPQQGLAEGDLVVIAGQAGLKDGVLVELPPEASAPADVAEAAP
jgi:membrane fusion protein (multidrug efflux system)